MIAPAHLSLFGDSSSSSSLSGRKSNDLVAELASWELLLGQVDRKAHEELRRPFEDLGVMVRGGWANTEIHDQLGELERAVQRLAPNGSPSDPLWDLYFELHGELGRWAT